MLIRDCNWHQALLHKNVFFLKPNKTPSTEQLRQLSATAIDTPAKEVIFWLFFRNQNCQIRQEQKRSPELCNKWTSNDVDSKKNSCCPGEYGWTPDKNTVLGWAMLHRIKLHHRTKLRHTKGWLLHKALQFFQTLVALEGFNVPSLPFQNLWSAWHTSTTGILAKCWASPLLEKPVLFAGRCTSGNVPRRRAAFDFCSGMSYPCLKSLNRWHRAPFPQLFLKKNALW